MKTVINLGAFMRLLFFPSVKFKVLKDEKQLYTTTFAIAKVVCYHVKIKNCHKNNEKR